MKGPGGVFEARFAGTQGQPGGMAAASLYCEKIRDPPTRRGKCACGGQLVTLCSRCRRAGPSPARFTPRAPYDFICRAPGGVLVAIECKATGAPSIAFAKLEQHQRDGLIAAGADGPAGVLVEYYRDDLAEAWYVPIERWIAAERELSRKSLSIGEARRRGYPLAATWQTQARPRARWRDAGEDPPAVEPPAKRRPVYHPRALMELLAVRSGVR